MNIQVSIIIPNYNGKEMLKECLESVFKQTIESLEVIVVDNASNDGSVQLLRDYKVRPVLNSENRGFSIAVNQGINAANGMYVFLLNNDVVLEKDTLSILIDSIQKDPQCFSIQPKMIQYHNRNRIDDSGNIYTLFGWAFKRGLGLRENRYSKSDIVFSCCAGAALYDRAKLQQVGLFDETYFAYMEDVDIGFRARNSGYHNRYCAETRVYHIGSASFGKHVSPLKTRLSARNNLLTIHNNMPLYQIIINLPFLLIGFLVKWIHFSRFGTGREYIRTVILTIRDLTAREEKKSTGFSLSQVWKNQIYICKDTCRFFQDVFMKLVLKMEEKQ